MMDEKSPFWLGVAVGAGAGALLAVLGTAFCRSGTPKGSSAKGKRLLQEKPYYFDYNATTPIHPEVSAKMRPFLGEEFGNPSSSYCYGKRSKQALEESRAQVAKAIGASMDREIIFTGGATESLNWAFKGLAFASQFSRCPFKRNHIIISAVEHVVVAEVCQYLRKFGFEITVIGVDSTCTVNVDEVVAAVTDKTLLVSIMLANNETGAIQPVGQIADRVKLKNKYVIVHTDASQALGKIPISVDQLNVDMLTLAGHKLYAPKGVGVLYCRDGVQLDNLLHGAGSQEFGKRAGTENVLLCVALGQACEIVTRDGQATRAHFAECRDRLQNRISSLLHAAFPSEQISSLMRVNGRACSRLPNTLSISFKGVQASALLSALSSTIAASAGSACHSGAVKMSSVLTAMGLEEEWGQGTLRLSVGCFTTLEQVDCAAEQIVRHLVDLRKSL